MKTAVGISLGGGRHNYEFETDFLGQRLKVWRLGTDGSTTKAVKLLKAWNQHADAIGLGAVKDSYRHGSRRFDEKDVERMKSFVTRIPVTTGERLVDILQELSLIHI